MLRVISIVAFIALAHALPSTDTVVPEVEVLNTDWRHTVAQDAQDQITLLLQEGKDDGACADLASATLKEVEESVAAQQSILDALDNGKDCPKEGQAAVDAAQNTLEAATNALADAEKAFADAQNAPVSVGAKPFSTLVEGNCDFFFSDSAYTSAKAAFANAKTALENAKGAEQGASAALTSAKEAQEKAVKQCQCDVRAAYNTAWTAANAQNEENAKAYTKGKHMQCVLEGTDPNSCTVGDVPKVSEVDLAEGVPAEPCKKFKHMSYVGCFGDNGARDLKHGPKNYGYSPRSCMDACSQYKYFALQNGGWCNCDNSYSDNFSGSGGRGSYNALAASECNKDGHQPGRGMGGGWANAVYEMKDSADGTEMLEPMSDFENWKGGCHIAKSGPVDQQVLQCNQGSNQMRTKRIFEAPLTVTLEMKQHHQASDECGVFQVFGDAGSRHGHYNAGMGWWTHYLGYGYGGADGHNQWQGKDGSTKRWRQITISVHTNGVATYWVDGQKYATKQGHAASGAISVGMNCRNYQYRLIQVTNGNW